MKDHGPPPPFPSADPRFQAARAHFDAGEFFEAHEVWESLWHALAGAPAEGRERTGGDRRFVQGLIQLAVSFEHWRRGNPRGARGQWEKAHEKLVACASPRDGVDVAGLLAEADAFYAAADLPNAEAAQRANAWTAPVAGEYPRIPRG